MSRIKNKKTPTKDISEFLTTTGFILEMEIGEFLTKAGYEVEVNHYFHDYDEDKDREIDIIASKTIKDIRFFLVVECKQSLVDDWIFVCSDRRPARYYASIKHLPEIEISAFKDKQKVFGKLHMFDSKIPLAQNYVIKDKTKNKKSTSIQINTCLEKIPKALVDLAYYRENDKIRTLFIPISVFSGQIFTAKYNKKLKVKNVSWIQYLSDLDSDGYKYIFDDHDFLISSLSIVIPPGQDKEETKKRKNSIVAKMSNRLRSKYLIDFVTKKGLKELVSRLESDIKNLESDSWSLPN